MECHSEIAVTLGAIIFFVPIVLIICIEVIDKIVKNKKEE